MDRGWGNHRMMLYVVSLLLRMTRKLLFVRCDSDIAMHHGNGMSERPKRSLLMGMDDLNVSYYHDSLNFSVIRLWYKILYRFPTLFTQNTTRT